LKWSFLGDLPTHQPFRALEVMLVSMLAENSSFCWTKNPPPFGAPDAGWPEPHNTGMPIQFATGTAPVLRHRSGGGEGRGEGERKTNDTKSSQPD